MYVHKYVYIYVSVCETN